MKLGIVLNCIQERREDLAPHNVIILGVGSSFCPSHATVLESMIPPCM